MNKFSYYIARIFDKFANKNRRDDYRKLWNGLSVTRDQAILNVIGKTNDAGILQSGLDFKEILSETIGLKKQDKVLEIGCGIGRNGMVLSPLCNFWIGCDVSSNMLRIARQNLKNITNFNLFEIEGYDLACVKGSSFDVVYCTTVFMHLEEWDRYNYVKEGYRILKERGRIYIDNFTICTEDGWKTFIDHCNIPRKQRTPYISKSSTPQELETFLQRTGFKDIFIGTRKEFVYAYGIK